ncbi:MAG: hypothetical protein HC815_31320 [Richelia sp. RM1_1_1]|nr:hypothetical protein [Richelia sp. SM2_1_7]NJN12210.1 hypothetical protein [Richelia sp. RM1_1_1]
MWQRILWFLGWLWAGFFILIGLVGLTQNFVMGLTFIVWGLIFLPPLFRLTSSYAIGWNIVGRIAALFITLIIGALLSPPPQEVKTIPPVKTTPANIVTPTFTPTVEPAPTLEPDIEITPEIIETPPPQNIPEPIEPAPTQQDPNAPVRAAVSGKCDCPYDTDKRGRSCGDRSAYSRPGGASPVCYLSDRQ